MSFEANQGQFDPQADFIARGSGYTVFLTPRDAVLMLQGPATAMDRHGQGQTSTVALRLGLVGANPQPRVSASESLPGSVNYFLGNDPARWRTNIPTYAKVRYHEIYSGIDLVYYGNQRQLEYDFVVRPGADPTRIAFAVEGAQRIEVDPEGDLVLHLAGGAIRHRKPVIYQEGDGTRREIAGGYVLKGPQQVGFQVAAYDASKPLVIDPTLVYSTLVGGGNTDHGLGIASLYAHLDIALVEPGDVVQRPPQGDGGAHRDADQDQGTRIATGMVRGLGESSGDISGEGGKGEPFGVPQWAGCAMAAQIVEAVSGTTFSWDYMHEHVFGRAGMAGSAYYTRDQWLTDEHIAHPYMRQADGSRVDAVRNLDKGTLDPFPGRNPGRSFLGHAFATAPDLVRFAHALSDGTLLNRPYADLFTGAKFPAPEPTAYGAYSGPVEILNGTQWLVGRGGGGGGIGVNWNIYPDTGWVSVILSNYDDIPLVEILQLEIETITGQPYEPPDGGG